jgi:hypothetical protein
MSLNIINGVFKVLGGEGRTIMISNFYLKSI